MEETKKKNKSNPRATKNATRTNDRNSYNRTNPSGAGRGNGGDDRNKGGTGHGGTKRKHDGTKPLSFNDWKERKESETSKEEREYEQYCNEFEDGEVSDR